MRYHETGESSYEDYERYFDGRIVKRKSERTKFNGKRAAGRKQAYAGSQTKPYRTIRRPVAVSADKIYEISNEAIDSPLVELFEPNSLGATLLTNFLTDRIFRIVYSGANNQKRAAAKFNEAVDLGLAEINQQRPKIEVVIGQVSVYESLRASQPDYLIGFTLDDKAKAQLTQDRLELSLCIAPEEKGLHNYVEKSEPHVSVAHTRYRNQAYYLAENLRSSDLIGIEFELGKVQPIRARRARA